MTEWIATRDDEEHAEHEVDGVDHQRIVRMARVAPAPAGGPELREWVEANGEGEAGDGDRRAKQRRRSVVHENRAVRERREHNNVNTTHSVA